VGTRAYHLPLGGPHAVLRWPQLSRPPQPPPLLYSLPGRRELGERAVVDGARCRLDPQVRLEARIAHGQQQATADLTSGSCTDSESFGNLANYGGLYLQNALGSVKKLQLSTR
jgi:hypothetical protein